MKITELINVFERLLPIYEKAYKEKEVRFKVMFGLCACANFSLNKFIYELFLDGYYKNITNRPNGCLFPFPETYKDLKPRIDFMKSEIKDLKRLIKLGYTHV